MLPREQPLGVSVIHILRPEVASRQRRGPLQPIVRLLRPRSEDRLDRQSFDRDVDGQLEDLHPIP